MLKLLPSPIGNLEDISFRTAKALEEAELFLCEDTRVTKKLLKLLKDKFNLLITSEQFISLHSHNEQELLNEQMLELLNSKNVVYMSDAGMPCVSDPGAKLVDFCINNNITYDVLPGANALLTAFAMSGFDNKEFTFFGFLDHKGNSRKDQLERAMNNDFISIIYESPHRIEKLVDEICAIDENRVLFIAKEITKLHQKSFKKSAIEIQTLFKTINLNGEWVVIIPPDMRKKEVNIDDILKLDISLKEKSKILAKLQNIAPKEAYNNLLRMEKQ